MTDSLRDLLARGADTVERPQLEVDFLVAQAERRLVRRRLGVVVATAAAVAVIAAGGLALQSDDQDSSPAPPAPSPTGTQDAKPALGPAIYFDALAVEGDELTDRILSINGQKDLYLVRQGGPARQIRATQANEHCPRVSPEGDMLAYLSGKSVVVRRLDANGHPGATVVTMEPDPNDEGVSCPQWSADGRQLAVAVAGFEAPDQTLEVHVIGVDGTDRLVAGQRDQFMPPAQIAWSPDGDAIAYTTPDSVWVAPLDGGEQKMLWRGRAPFHPSTEGFPPYPGMPTRLEWLVTGEIAVSTHTDVDQVEALHIVDSDTGRGQVIGTFPMDAATPSSWSPDGSRLVFADSDGTVRMFNRASDKAVPVKPRLDGKEIGFWKFAWSTDGQQLVGTAANPSTEGFALVSMDPDGSSVEVLTPWSMALYSSADLSWGPP